MMAGNTASIECPECSRFIRANAMPLHLSSHARAGGLSEEGAAMQSDYETRRRLRPSRGNGTTKVQAVPIDKIEACRCCGVGVPKRSMLTHLREHAHAGTMTEEGKQFLTYLESRAAYRRKQRVTSQQQMSPGSVTRVAMPRKGEQLEEFVRYIARDEIAKTNQMDTPVGGSNSIPALRELAAKWRQEADEMEHKAARNGAGKFRSRYLVESAGRLREMASEMLLAVDLS